MKIYFLKHLKDLQLHFILYLLLFISIFFISYIYSDQWIYILIKPLISLKNSNYLIFTDITEIFIIKIIISLFISILFSTLCGFFQLWFFLSPGLYKNENIKIIYTLLIFIIILLLSIYFIYFFLIPNVWKFFIEFEKTNYPFLYQIYLEPKLYNYKLGELGNGNMKYQYDIVISTIPPEVYIPDDLYEGLIDFAFGSGEERKRTICNGFELLLRQAEWQHIIWRGVLAEQE